MMSLLGILVADASLFVTVSRKLVLWGDCAAELRPALYLHEVDDDINEGTDGRPQIITMHVNLFIYTWAKNVATPAALLNPLIDSMFLALKPSPMTGKNNLGLAFVDHCWISGKLFKDAGDLDGDGMAIIPVKIRMSLPVVYFPVP